MSNSVRLLSYEEQGHGKHANTASISPFLVVLNRIWHVAALVCAALVMKLPCTCEDAAAGCSNASSTCDPCDRQQHPAKWHYRFVMMLST